MRKVIESFYHKFLLPRRERPSVDEDIDWRTTIALFQQYPMQATRFLYDIIGSTMIIDDPKNNPFLFELCKILKKDIQITIHHKDYESARCWTSTISVLKWEWTGKEPQLFDIPELYKSLLEFCDCERITDEQYFDLVKPIFPSRFLRQYESPESFVDIPIFELNLKEL